MCDYTLPMKKVFGVSAVQPPPGQPPEEPPQRKPPPWNGPPIYPQPRNLHRSPYEIMHFTIIQKFGQRIQSLTLSRLLNLLMKMFNNRGEKIPSTAIDSSGFTSSYASHYYSWRNGKKTISEDIDLH